MPNCTAARVPACVAMCVARHAHGELHQPEPHSRMLTHHDRAVHMHMLYARHTTMRSRRCSGRSLSAPVSGARLPTTRRRREEQAERGAAQRQRWRHLLPHRLGTPVTGVKRPLSVEGARRGVLLAVAGRAGTGSVDGGGLRSDFGHSDMLVSSTSLFSGTRECVFILPKS